MSDLEKVVLGALAIFAAILIPTYFLVKDMEKEDARECTEIMSYAVTMHDTMEAKIACYGRAHEQPPAVHPPIIIPVH